MRDSNPRPPRCKRGALPTELIALPSRPDWDGFTTLIPASIQRVAQSLAWLELGLFRRGNLDFLSGPRIAPFRSRPRRDRKRTKSDEANLIAPFQGLDDCVEHRVDSPTRLRLSQLRLAGDGIDQFIPVHGLPPCASVRDAWIIRRGV